MKEINRIKGQLAVKRRRSNIVHSNLNSKVECLLSFPETGYTRYSTLRKSVYLLQGSRRHTEESPVELARVLSLYFFSPSSHPGTSCSLVHYFRRVRV